MFILLPIFRWTSPFHDNGYHYVVNDYASVERRDYWATCMQSNDGGGWPMKNCDWSPFNNEV
jgi:hypothetical protein